MLWAVAGGALAIVAVGLAVLVVLHRRRRTAVYAQLASRREELIRGQQIAMAAAAPPEALHTQFQQLRLVRTAGFLTPECLARLRAEAEENIPRMVRSYLPTHKKGSTLSYESIYRYAPGCLAFYHSPRVGEWISAVVGQEVYPTPEQDQSSLSVLCYKEAGDHIQWHYDHNFYRGRHFTVLLSLCNSSAAGGLSSSRLVYKDDQGSEVEVDTSPNVLVLFEGARVLHRATPTAEGDLRIMLSMTYCCDPRIRWWREVARRVKDTGFFGLRALWQ